MPMMEEAYASPAMAPAYSDPTGNDFAEIAAI
jgi:hypothetical protein